MHTGALLLILAASCALGRLWLWLLLHLAAGLPAAPAARGRTPSAAVRRRAPRA